MGLTRKGKGTKVMLVTDVQGVPKPGRKADVSNYRNRWKVERTFAWLSNFRRVVVRYERLARVYFAFVLIAFILICSDRMKATTSRDVLAPLLAAAVVSFDSGGFALAT